jgi:cellobiose transport system permease protein
MTTVVHRRTTMSKTAAWPPTQPQKERSVRRIAFSQTLSRWDVKISPYLYISPFFILFAITGMFPLAYTAWVSVHEWNLIGGQGDFVGFDNFAFVLSQPPFWIALRNTFSIFLISAVPQVAFALLIAAVLDRNLRAKTFWRMGVLLPYVVAPVAVTLIFSNMFGDQYGLINNLLNNIGLDPIGWHSDVVASHIAIATMVNFRWTGYTALILLAAMQAIPRDYYEASMIDGAGIVRQFFSITIPQLRPTLIFVIVTSTIGGLQIFDEPRLYDQYGQGGASSQWMTITIYLYNLGWGQLNFGRAAAVAWLLFLIIVLVSLVNVAITRSIAKAS